VILVNGRQALVNMGWGRCGGRNQGCRRILRSAGRPGVVDGPVEPAGKPLLACRAGADRLHPRRADPFLTAWGAGRTGNGVHDDFADQRRGRQV